MPISALPVEADASLSVLVVESDPVIRAASCEVLQRLGHETRFVDKPEPVVPLLRHSGVDIVLLTLKSPIMDGLKFVDEVRTTFPSTAVVVISEDPTVSTAVAAMRAGASDLLVSPFSAEELAEALERAAELGALDVAGRSLRKKLLQQQGRGSLIGRSPEMDKLYRMLGKVARSSHPALILGESGTGKELVARSIHINGPNFARPFIPVDCGSLMPTLIESELFGHVKGAFTGADRDKEGLLASAQDGTIFLDEIGELPLDLQSRLLRALQEKEVRPLGSNRSVAIRARILAATNRDLAALVDQGRFRKDLYYRLNVVNLRVPPLRERKTDVPLLAAQFLMDAGRENKTTYTLNDEAQSAMNDYAWPGNVRELEHAIMRAATMCSGNVLQLNDLPSPIVNFAEQQRKEASVQFPGKEQVDRMLHDLQPERKPTDEYKMIPLAMLEQKAIVDTLRATQGDKLIAAKILGIGKTTLYRKLKEYGFDESLRLQAGISVQSNQPQAAVPV